MKCKYFLFTLSFPHIKPVNIIYRPFRNVYCLWCIKIDELYFFIIIYGDVSNCLAFNKNIYVQRHNLTHWKMFSNKLNIIETQQDLTKLNQFINCDYVSKFLTPHKTNKRMKWIRHPLPRYPLEKVNKYDKKVILFVYLY